MDKQPSRSRSDDDREHGVPEAHKRPYVAPKLTTYGTLARLTRHGQGSGFDGGAVMSMMCL